MGFCYQCGQALSLAIPSGDDQQRECCSHCGYVHYVNPRILVSCMVHTDTELLWIRRGLEPRQGFWAMPAGFMEHGESLQEATVRELKEETGLALDPNTLSLYVLSSLTFIDEVYVVFRAHHEALALTPPSAEIEDIAFFNEQNAPWGQLAYPETEHYMRQFYREIKNRQFETYIGEFTRHKHALLSVGEQAD